MTTEQLRYFITIINTCSYMEAALELNISQSTVSKQIHILERELGVTLFDRSSRKAKLTPEGQKLLPEARSLLEKIDHFFYSASELRSDNINHFTIITLPFMGFLNLYGPLNCFESAHPDLHLEIIEMEEPQLRKQLSSGDFDLAITYEHEFWLNHGTQHFIPIVEDEAVFAVHKSHPLALHQTIMLHDLTNIPLLLMGDHTCVSKECARYFSENNFIPQIDFRGMPETLIAGVKAKRGGAIISKKQAMNYVTDEIAIIPFEPSLPIAIGAIPNDSSPRKEYIQALLTLLTTNNLPAF